ncbi:4-hydroxy-tetrahydrodipicolinate reductase [Bacteroidia bacterium]|nr:4-hydroxy-tetrahydrodipicolinate reductase [Bacteroidia bacterium]
MLKIALIGYGKMGKTIEQVAKDRGHEVVAAIDSGNFTPANLNNADVAIEFTQPDVAHLNIAKCFDADVPVVVGTTAWYDHYEALAYRARTENKTLFTATNFSIGVNILFHINEKLSHIMNGFSAYDVKMTETHHLQKLDHPSGTAVTLAEGILNHLDRKKKYVGLLEGKSADITPFDLHIESKRREGVPGYHAITYKSEIDELTISHNAKSRLGFAQGALVAAEWVAHRKGVFGMKDLLNF